MVVTGRGPRAAFTLVELLVASTMTAILFTGLGAHLRGGLAVWERATTTAEQLQRRRVALDRLERELANSLGYDAREDAYGDEIGTLPRPEFAADRLAWFTAAPAGSDGMPSIRFVTYACGQREAGEGLWRTSQTLGEAKAKQPAAPELLLPGCRALRVQYAHAPRDPAEPLAWRAEWKEPPSMLPSLLDVTLTIGSHETVRRVMLVPPGRLKAAETE